MRHDIIEYAEVSPVIGRTVTVVRNRWIHDIIWSLSRVK